MVSPDLVAALDSSLPRLARDAAHVHIAARAVLEGPALDHEQLIGAITLRPHPVPRSRQRPVRAPR